MSENVVEVPSAEVAGEVVSAPMSQDIVAQSAGALALSGTVLSEDALVAAVKGGDQTRKDYRLRAAALSTALESSQTVTVAYMVRLEDMIESDKQGKPAKASHDKITDAYRDLLADPDRMILKSRLSQLRNVAEVVIDCGFPLSDPEASWFVSKATTGQMSADAIHAAAALGRKGEKAAAVAHLKDTRTAEAEAKAKALEAAEAAKAKASEASGAPDTRQNESQSGTSATGDTRSAQTPDGSNVEKDPYTVAVSALVALPQASVSDVVALLRLQAEVAVRLSHVESALLAEAQAAYDAEVAAEAAEVEANRKAAAARKASPATVRKSAPRK